jgi:hypothetical protein
VFAGVSFNGVKNALTAPFIETLTVSATGKIVTAYAPQAGTLAIINSGNTLLSSVAQGTDPTTLTATQYSLDATAPQTYNFNATLNAGAVVTVAYRFAPNAFQNIYLQGMQLPGGPAGDYLGQTDVIQHGDVYTSEFDTSANWATAVGVTLQANGLFGATAVLASALANVKIISLPSAGAPFLGIALDVA